ncbi:hypothetical protein DPX16_23755 [Anabarilius grahami]|uniref:Uncharacterized protein n=1 Tax=Anabarilius grahami TaxID=495550 RepID=A0A3N0YGQ5_ANAGA|nr:hypothetical protein DPX16_23755 [Anabarilius grahami]
MDGLLRNCATGCRVDEAFTMDDLVDSISVDTSGLRCGHVQLRIVFITPKEQNVIGYLRDDVHHRDTQPPASAQQLYAKIKRERGKFYKMSTPDANATEQASTSKEKLEKAEEIVDERKDQFSGVEVVRICKI